MCIFKLVAIGYEITKDICHYGHKTFECKQINIIFSDLFF